MTEEELERFLMQSFNTQMKGIGAAGARSSWNVPLPNVRDDKITTQHEPASEQGQEILDSLATLTPEQIIQKALEAGALGSVPYLAMLNTLLKIKEETDPRVAEQFPKSILGENDPDPRGTGAPGKTDPTTDQELFNEIMKEFLERDRSPAPEIPEYVPLEKEEFERGPPSWLTRGDYITAEDDWSDAKPVFDYPMELRPGNASSNSWFPTGSSASDPRVIRYHELMPPYRSAVEAFNKEELAWRKSRPDANLYDMATYLGKQVRDSWDDENIEGHIRAEKRKAQELRNKGYSPGPDFGWEGDPSAANKEFEEFRKQQEFAERNHREEYDSMVAEIKETERLRQEEDAAERQRYTDKYNENPYFYDNLLSGGGSSEWAPLSPFPSDETYSTEMDRHPGQEGWKGLDDFWNALGAAGPALDMAPFPGDYSHRLDPSVGQPITPVNPASPPISQEEIILNQSKPGAYIYPGILN